MFAATALATIVVGRLIAGFGVGFVSAIIILYMVRVPLSVLRAGLSSFLRPQSEIAPKKIRGTLVAGYQFCVTIGLMLGSIVDNYTQDRTDSGAYRIPIGVQVCFLALHPLSEHPS